MGFPENICVHTNTRTQYIHAHTYTYICKNLTNKQTKKSIKKYTYYKKHRYDILFVCLQVGRKLRICPGVASKHNAVASLSQQRGPDVRCAVRFGGYANYEPVTSARRLLLPC